MKTWSLPKHENLTTGKNNIVEKEQFFLFPQYFQHISNFKSPVTHIFVKCGCSSYFFLNSANLICRGTDISKYFRESLGIRDTESTGIQHNCFQRSSRQVLVRAIVSKYRCSYYKDGVFAPAPFVLLL